MKKIFDQYGNHTGYIEKTGGSRDKIRDEFGNHTGYIEKTGSSKDKILDQYGNPMGHIDATGKGSNEGTRSSSGAGYGSGDTASGIFEMLVSLVGAPLLFIVLIMLIHSSLGSETEKIYETNENFENYELFEEAERVHVETWEEFTSAGTDMLVYGTVTCPDCNTTFEAEDSRVCPWCYCEYCWQKTGSGVCDECKAEIEKSK